MYVCALSVAVVLRQTGRRQGRLTALIGVITSPRLRHRVLRRRPLTWARCPRRRRRRRRAARL